MTESRTRLQWAKWFAAKGISVFIIQPGSKQPIEGYSWYLRQSTDAGTIASWFDQTEDCNYGVHLGENFVVIDLDVKPGANGVAAFEKICAEHGIDDFRLELDTLMTRTPGGGYHLYFKSPFPCSNRNSFPDGIDVRGVQGYVVGPGSVDSRGEWKIIDPSADIMKLPDWLEGYVEEPGRKAPNADVPVVDLDLEESVEEALRWLEASAPAVQGESGDNHTYETVAVLRDFGLSEVKILEVLNLGWNQRCDPPWSDAELEAKIRNTWAYAQNRPGVRSPAWRAQLINEAQAGWSDYIAKHYPHAGSPRLAVGNTAPAVGEDDTPGKNEEPDVSAHLFNVRDFLRRGKRRKFVIPGWLPARGFTGLLAKRGTGKSAIMTDLAARIACGIDWQDLPIDPAYTVSIYLCGEDDDGLELNLAAWEKEHGRMIPTDRLIISDKIMQLKDRAEVEAWAGAIAEKVGDRLAAVFLDTWQRATATTKGQSADDEMALCVENAEYLLSRLNAPGIVAFHPPKAIKAEDELTVMGSSVIENTSVAIWTLWERADGLRLRAPRIKGAAKGGYRMFKLRVIELDEKDQFGRPQTAVIPEKFAGVEDSPEKRKAREEAQREAWAWMVRHLIEGQHGPGGVPFTPNRDQIAKRAAEAMERTDSRLYGIWHREAERAGLASFSERTIRRELTDWFFPESGHGRAVDFEDGLRLTVVGKGRKRMFKLVDSPLAWKGSVSV